ncbi:MAG: HAMP domain-containing sensor histidine kinase [Balneolaceae bacterium]|nr:HAMP domain-containing sensor histidine kinase [Balneolaceae bacterium]
MNTLFQSSRIKIILVSLLVLLAGASFVYNQLLINKIMAQERKSVELWAKAFEFNYDPVHLEVSTTLNRVADMLSMYPNVPDSLARMIRSAESARTTEDFVSQQIITPQDLFNIPVIVRDESGFVTSYRFIEDEDADIEALAEQFAEYHEPITISFGPEDQMQNQYVYYGESPTIRYLRFFPYVQFGILALLLGIGYVTYKSITRSEQSNLWVGMTKEAAHQLGTPLSSIYGWLQLLKDKNPDDKETLSIAYEIENDVTRLKGIAERFSKIGSHPELKEVHPEPIIDEVITYMKRRLPQLGKSIEVRKSVQTNVKAHLNPELFQWAIENLIKNAMDAIKETVTGAYVAISVKKDGSHMIIDVEDSGSGIDRKYQKEIFKPGYSTKKRGWGLGLSLTKRIIEEYHKGKVFVYTSEMNKGTVIRITLPI